MLFCFWRFLAATQYRQLHVRTSEHTFLRADCPHTTEGAGNSLTYCVCPLRQKEHFSQTASSLSAWGFSPSEVPSHPSRFLRKYRTSTFIASGAGLLRLLPNESQFPHGNHGAWDSAGCNPIGVCCTEMLVFCCQGAGEKMLRLPSLCSRNNQGYTQPFI